MAADGFAGSKSSEEPRQDLRAERAVLAAVLLDDGGVAEERVLGRLAVDVLDADVRLDVGELGALAFQFGLIHGVGINWAGRGQNGSIHERKRSGFGPGRREAAKRFWRIRQ